MKKNLVNLRKYDIINQTIPIMYYIEKNSDIILVVSYYNLFFSLYCLKNHITFRYTILSNLSGIDLQMNKYRFGVVYDLLSIKFNSRIRVKVFINEVTPLESVVDLYSSANWWEREIWDFFGIYFIKHPDLRRILTDYGFEGYPMRKDFPLSGYVELRYDIIKKRIVIEPLELSQEYRHFTFDAPWEQ